MSPEELRSWLRDHAERISTFMDYEIYFESDDEFMETLDMWMPSSWRSAGYRFISIGGDLAGARFALGFVRSRASRQSCSSAERAVGAF